MLRRRHGRPLVLLVLLLLAAALAVCRCGTAVVTSVYTVSLPTPPLLSVTVTLMAYCPMAPGAKLKFAALVTVPVGSGYAALSFVTDQK